MIPALRLISLVDFYDRWTNTFRLQCLQCDVLKMSNRIYLECLDHGSEVEYYMCMYCNPRQE